MAAYVANAFNSALPSADDVAGHADKEFRALKERLNSQIGDSLAINIGNRVPAIEATVTAHDQHLVLYGQRITATESVANGAAQGVATNASAINTLNTGFNSLNSTVSSQGSTIASHTNSINALNTWLGQTNTNLANLTTTVNGQGTTLAGHTASINSNTSSIASLAARPTIYLGPGAPGAFGKDGDIYVQYV